MAIEYSHLTMASLRYIRVKDLMVASWSDYQNTYHYYTMHITETQGMRLYQTVDEFGHQ